MTAIVCCSAYHCMGKDTQRGHTQAVMERQRVVCCLSADGATRGTRIGGIGALGEAHR